MVNLSKDEVQTLSVTGIGVRRKRVYFLFPPFAEAEDAQSGEGGRVNEEWGREQEQGIAQGNHRTDQRVLEGNVLQVQVALGERIGRKQDQTGQARENKTYKGSRIRDSFEHDDSPP